VWSALTICAISTFVEQDAKRPNGEHETLVGEQTTITQPHQGGSDPELRASAVLSVVPDPAVHLPASDLAVAILTATLNPVTDDYGKNNFAKPLSAWRNWKIKGRERGEVGRTGFVLAFIGGASWSQQRAEAEE
jgi:hypothetical protein